MSYGTSRRRTTGHPAHSFSSARILLRIWLGRSLTELYTKFFHFPALTFQVSAAAIAISVGTTVLAALVGSLSAVQRVVALPPAEGMRGEAPLRFGLGLLDRTNLIRAVSPPVRMILRSLQRTPLRTAMSLLAMAMAAAILVVGQFAFDALESMIDVQFGHGDPIRFPSGPMTNMKLYKNRVSLPSSNSCDNVTGRRLPVPVSHCWNS